MKYVGIVEDKWVTPYVEVTFYERYKYIEFPFAYDNEYQKKRYYPQDKILEKYKFEYMKIPKPWVTGINIK